MGRNLLGFKGIKPVLVAVALLTLVQSISILWMARTLSEVVSALFAGGTLQDQKAVIIQFLAAFLVRHLTNFAQQKITYRYAEHTGALLRKRLMDKLFLLGPRFAKTEGTGKLVTLVLDGVLKFKVYLELIIPRMVATAIIPAVIFIYIFTQDVQSAIILLVTMPILIVFMILIGLSSRKQVDSQMVSYRNLANHFVDSLRGLETLKYLGRSKSHAKTIGNVSDKYRKATMRTLRVAFLSSFALDFFTMLSVASVAVGLGLRLVNGDMMLVTALTILILAPEYFLPVRMVGADYHATLNGKEAGEAIQAIIDMPIQKMDVTLPNGFSYSWRSDSQLTLSHVQVQHEAEGPHSLQDVTLHIQGMRKIGIIGESGAGKSTLIDVLSGFLPPSSGDVELNGHRLPALTDESWQNQMTYIPQSPYLFSSSLADNVKFYTPNASQEEVEQAVKNAGLLDLVSSLPLGYDEVIGGGGRTLSGGQAQRVALARAFLSDRPVILLDEPTAHLDIETEYELKKTMLSLFEGKLVFLATHRLHWMPDMDQIIVMDQGKVAEIGTHEELLACKGVYYALIRSQLEGVL
ncbi:thiol reductant ABC exporter subunit CydD [Paenibacillus macquariensis]|uniref:ATP-binding cassette, subfamily C, CydD n=1 Tax=Paenibacillus macquariensis TaxID=948756 RepID=A0ABY1K9V7_9BACL|nr:thiol reductant ABC exporter subunit CydD [Paenibacillus macquariensis]MEC0092378.1 thiol reductant ABC exporter subunit CydD [Paenibacillus macquariensis]OAB35352.1 thiol reductant ABC exporter subunit CydD [Paenibacillus macquariensis subsp. macquariensis]SIR48140.1 ATP-binding cassette, subfamily C, CydD [Paenibacillus macquariensis]